MDNRKKRRGEPLSSKTGKKTSHVALYIGDRSFVHAPSGGKRGESVSFEHVFWAARLESAGRLGL